jgi:nitrite reductase (NADH) small subunit
MPEDSSPETNEAPFVTVARVGAIADGQSEAFAVQGRMVAVFRAQDTYYAIDDFCPHMGASLAGGTMESGLVVCPWHAWCFSVRDGTWIDNPKIKVDCFEVRVQDDEIQVRVPPRS